MAAKGGKAVSGRNATAGPGTKVLATAAAAQEVRRAVSTGKDLSRIRVRAIEMGYYQHKRRREGDVFDLIPLMTVERDARGTVVKDPKTRRTIPVIKTAAEQFSEKWMEVVGEDTPSRITGVKQALTDKHDAIIRDRFNLGDPEASDDEEVGAPAAGDQDEDPEAVGATGDQDVL